jgi:hypothetical protein
VACRRRNAVLIPAFALIAALIGVSPARGQTVGTATGSIVGTVTDTAGGVLPSVNVTVAGEALMGIRQTLTNAEGRFRVVALPPGEYTISVAFDGFTTFESRNVRVGAGSTSTIDAVLSPRLSEHVTVRTPGNILDRRATTLAHRLETAHLRNLPIARDINAYFNSALGVESPDVTYGTRGTNRPVVEGMLVTGFRSVDFTLDDGSFEEVSVIAGAQGPAWATPGVHLQYVSKAGGNQYRGTLYADYQNDRWQSFNIDESQIARGAEGGLALSPREVNRLWRHHDVNADVGGFIVKDRLWWYSSVREQETEARRVNFLPKPHSVGQTNYTGKGTYRLTPVNTLAVYGQVGWHHEPNTLEGFVAGSVINETEASTANKRAVGRVWKGEWTSFVRDSLALELRAGQFAADVDWTPISALPRFEDRGTLVVTGGNRDYRRSLRRNQLFATVNHFVEGPTGSHDLKAGIEVLDWVDSEAWRAGYPGNVLHILQNGAPDEVYRISTPSLSMNGLRQFSAHATDSWQLGNRLTLNIGVRFDRHRVFLPAQEHSPKQLRFDAVENLIAWNVVAPRLGAVYDVTGTGATLLKASYGKYRIPPGQILGINSNPNSNVWYERYDWVDRNGSGVWDPGEEDGDATDSRGGRTFESLDPNVKLPVVDELTASLERELPAGVALRTGAVWRSERNHFMRQNVNRPFAAFTVPVSLADPGPDGDWGNEDDGPAVAALALAPEFWGLRPSNIVRNVPGSKAEYWTWEIAATRRLQGRWSLTAGFTHTRHQSQAGSYAGQTVRNNPFPVMPSDFINTGEGGAHVFTTWSAKAYGTYTAPYDVRITPMVRHNSGQPFGRTFQAQSNTLMPGAVVVLAEPVGTHRLDNTTLVDLRIEKGIRLNERCRLAGFADVYNLFNSNAEQEMIWLSGPSFLRPLSITPPRIARIGLKMDW